METLFSNSEYIIKKHFPFKSNYYTTQKGFKMHYVDEGRGMPVIMVHGNPTWSFYYRNLIKALKDTCRPIAVDHIGCGLSQKPKQYPYTLEQHINNLSELIDHLNINQFHLIVHDWGGPIGLGCALRMPEKLQKVVLMNTSVFKTDKISKRIRFSKHPFVRKLFVRYLNTFVWGAQLMATEQRLTPEVKLCYRYPYTIRTYNENYHWRSNQAISAFLEDIPLSHNHPSFSTLAKIEDQLPLLNNKKLLIAWGGKDFCFNTTYYHAWLQRFPHAESHFFDNAGHYVLEDAKKKLLAVIRDFL